MHRLRTPGSVSVNYSNNVELFNQCRVVRCVVLELLGAYLRPMLARSAQHQVDYCHTNSVRMSVRLSVSPFVCNVAEYCENG